MLYVSILRRKNSDLQVFVDRGMTFPNTMHAYDAPEENAYYSMIICHPRLFGDYLNELMHSAPFSPVIRAPFLHEDIPYAINRLAEEQQSDAASHGVCRSLIQLILARAMPLLNLEERPSPSALDLPNRVIAYISKNFRQPISLDDVAKQVGASKCHISRIFSSKLHTNFHSYVNSFRLNLAQNLLCNTDLNILTISQECGFENQRTFNRVFKDQCHTTPSQYRADFIQKKNLSI